MNAPPAIERHADARSASHAAGAAIASALAGGVAQFGRAGFAGAGGRTPGETYAWLSTADLPWDKVTVTLTDERWVDPDSPDSNEGLMRRALLTERAAAARLLPLWSAAPTPEEAAAAAGAMLAEHLPLDAVLLGMGDDGHFASLFPGNPALAEGLDLSSGKLVIAAPAGEPMPPQPRISLTLPALLKARTVILLITGEAKLYALEAEDAPVAALLAQTVTPVRILWAP